MGSAPIQHVVLKGEMNNMQREEALREFQTNPSCKVLLISYKVGSEGLNLVEANHVICVDPWWTYAVADQAKARAFRPGQKKTVYTYDIFSKAGEHETIERRVVEICEIKKVLAYDLIGAATLASTSRKVDLSKLGKTNIQNIANMSEADLARLAFGDQILEIWD
jgi:SNF2 family DNA or RNA helicase